MIDLDVCVYCERRFSGTSHPRWAITPDGRVAGLLHANCSARKTDPYNHMFGETAEHAQYAWWVWGHERQVADRSSPRYWASHLACFPILEWTPAHDELVAWWCTEGTLKLGAEMAGPIREAWEQIVREFREWQATLREAVPTP